jgi:hypothetical protein
VVCVCERERLPVLQSRTLVCVSVCVRETTCSSEQHVGVPESVCVYLF